MGLADDRVSADGFHRRIAFHSQSHDAGQIAADGNGEIELLIFDEVAVRDGFTAAGKDAVLHRELIFRNVETFGGDIEKRLIDVRGGFTDVRRPGPGGRRRRCRRGC